MEIIKINLQLFSDGGEGAAASAATTDDVQKDAAPSGAQAGQKGTRVLYGKQPPEVASALSEKESDGKAQETGRAGFPAARSRSGGGSEQDASEGEKQSGEESFEELIKGKYKDDFEKLLSRRFKKSAQTESQNSAMRTLLENVAISYGLDPESDSLLDDIKKAQDADEELYQKAAYEKGISPEEYRKELAKDRKIKELSRKVEENEQRERNTAWVQHLKAQVPQVQNMFPNFDLDTEMQNPDFAYLVRPGSPTSLEAAMYAVHHREILSGAVKTAAQQAAEQTANAVATNKARPKEGGLSAVPPTVVKDDPSKWSKEDLAEIRRRVERGEKIRL